MGLKTARFAQKTILSSMKPKDPFARGKFDCDDVVCFVPLKEFCLCL